jgi:hypothetical protein
MVSSRQEKGKHVKSFFVFFLLHSSLLDAFHISLHICKQTSRRTAKHDSVRCTSLKRKMTDDESQHLNDGCKESKMAWENERLSNLLRRFTDPVIDDPGLPLSDVLVAQVIGPSLQIAWISMQHAPQPSWLRPFFDIAVLYSKQGSFVAPALVHGAALASCWITGALAAKAYERNCISPILKQRQDLFKEQPRTDWDYSNVFYAIVKSGAFASGLLLLTTQIDILLEFGRYVQFGESDEVDFRLLLASVEVLNDIVFEAVTITAWRLFLAYQTERMAKE